MAFAHPKGTELLQKGDKNQLLTVESSAILIGVAGGSGSGKTTFSRMLKAHLGENFTALLHQDSYYLDQSARFDHDGGRVNYDHPSAIEFSLMVEHLKLLKVGLDIDVPIYDFTSHKRSQERLQFGCRPVIIVDGILLLSQPKVRECLDFSVFIDTPEEIRFQRRLYRDVRERGRTPEGVQEQFLKQVKPMHDLFVEPSRQFANKAVRGDQSFGPVLEEFVYGFWSRPQASSMPLSHGPGEL